VAADPVAFAPRALAGTNAKIAKTKQSREAAIIKLSNLELRGIDINQN
jgi:hypothetical protein